MNSDQPAIPATPADLTIDSRADSRLTRAGERLAAILDGAIGDGLAVSVNGLKYLGGNAVEKE